MPQTLKTIEYSITKFDLKKIKPNTTIAVYGRHGAGKSTLIEDICYNMRETHTATVFCESRKEQKSYLKIVPEDRIHKRYNEEVVEEIMATHDPKSKGTLIVMDDSINDTRIWTKDENIRNIFINGQTDNLMLVFTMQYPLGIPPDLRNRIDYVFLLRENNADSRRRLFEHYAGLFPTSVSFNHVFNALTNDFGCFVFDNTIPSNNIEDTVFYYKAQVHNDP